MAKVRVFPVMHKISEEILMIHKNGYFIDKSVLLDCFTAVYQLENEKNEKICEAMIGLSADIDKKIAFNISPQSLKEIFLNKIIGLAELTNLNEKIRDLKTIIICLDFSENSRFLYTLFVKTFITE